MKVTEISVLIHNRANPLPGPVTVPVGVVSIHTDEGLVGNSFIGAPGANVHHIAEQIVREVAPRLVGSDPLLITQHWALLTGMSRSLHVTVVGSIDVALWDLAGKAAGMPVHRMLGTAREAVPAYLSSWVHRRTEDYVDEALHYQALGYTGYKLHPLTQRRTMMAEHVARNADIATCRAVRDAVGPSMDLMLDSAWAYGHKEALDVGVGIQELDFLWYEDPLRHPDDIYGYAKLREKLTVPILATEITEGGVFAYPPWLEQRATDALRGDPSIKGGITGMMKIAHLAEAYRLNCEVHDSYSSLMNVAALNVVVAISNTSSFEVLTINPTGSYGLDHVNYGLADPIVVDEAGLVHAPTKPGLGHDLDWELLRSDVDFVIR
jgi:L-alanine-DL-glutamate epimerase-like enolase superfamily enzyme